jgi:hypothetical protein
MRSDASQHTYRRPLLAERALWPLQVEHGRVALLSDAAQLGQSFKRFIGDAQVRQHLVPPYNHHTTVIQPPYSLLKMGHPLHALPLVVPAAMRRSAEVLIAAAAAERP